MTFLTDKELESLRTEVLELMPDTCRIERMTSSNTGGYVSETWGTAVASVACRFDPDTRLQSDDVIAERESQVDRYIVTMAYNVDVQSDDRLVYASGVYQIRQLSDNHSARLFRRLHVEQIRGG